MSRRKKTVLLALTDAHHGFFQGAARFAREQRWHLVADMIYTAKIPHGWRGDGILSFIGYRDELAEFVLSSNVPAVEISMVRNDLPLPKVEGENETIGRLAAEHFLARGFKHYVWAPFMEDIVNAERYRGFSGELGKQGLSCRVLPVAGSVAATGGTLDWNKRREILMETLRELPKPLAVFGYNDCVAADIVDACEEAGLLVPEEVAVMGVDNDEILCECLRVPLSSVCHDLEEMAYQAAALLNRLMEGEKPPQEVLRIKPKGVVTRRSTETMAVEDLGVAKALRFIADHFSDSMLSVNDVVAASGVSRRVLEKAFRRELNRTINEEVLRVRIRAAQELLLQSGQKVAEIAAAVGFTRDNHFFRCFRQQLGTTPRAWRAKETEKIRPGGKVTRRRVIPGDCTPIGFL